ncbi:iron dicitrate transporter FecR [Spirochaetia bacterium]|nr:iron dicitrate transporter FecR [Spirochaetia bacterium]
MKKTFVAAMMMILGAAVFAQTGVIKELAGTVELKRSGAAAFTPARAGDTVAKDTIVSTGFKSSAIITVGSSVITVRPLTSLSFSDISAQAGTETLNVNLQAGRVRVDVSPPVGTRARMSVQGPSATASVRGTSFEFDTSNLQVLEGTVAFEGNRGETVLVRAGSTSRIDADGRVVHPLITNAEKLYPLAETDSGKSTDALPPSMVDISISLSYL